MQARQDWEAWLRPCKKYEAGYAGDILMVYNHQKGKHISKSHYTQARGVGIIVRKNMYYLKKNKYDHWYLLLMISRHYTLAVLYGKSLLSWIKAFMLQPFKRRNLEVLKMIIKEFLKSKLLKHAPNLFYRLRTIKRRLKGETTN